MSLERAHQRRRRVEQKRRGASVPNDGIPQVRDFTPQIFIGSSLEEGVEGEAVIQELDDGDNMAQGIEE